jgi:Dolichyl-phosphate-mannose-protein mannosyltransferase
VSTVATRPTPSTVPRFRLGRPVGSSLLLLGAITTVGILLRVPSFSDSLNGDELATYYVVTDHGFDRIIEIVRGDQEVTPPLYLLLAGLTQGIGDQMDSLRWVPLLSGIASIPLTYALGVQLVARRAALTAAAIMALSPFLIFYSTEARAYAPAMLFALGSTFALVRAARGGRRWWWALYAALSCAAMYTHYTVAFVLAGQAVWALVYHRDAWRWLIGSNIAAAIAWAPWLSSYQADQDSPGAQLIGILQPFGFDAFKTDVLHWAFGHPLTLLSVREMPGNWAIGLIALGLAIAVAGIGWEMVRQGRVGLPGEGVSLVFILALSTPVLAALYSAVSVSVFLPRNLISSSPGLALALGLIVTRPRARAVWVSATAALVAGFAVAGARMLADDSDRADYKGVASFIADRGGGPLTTVDSPGLSPGPLSQLDVAFAPGKAEPRDAAALRLGRPTRAAQLRASQPGGPGQFAVLPIPSPASIARQAVRRANGRPIFLVNPGDFTFSEIRGELGSGSSPEARAHSFAAPATDLGAFARALPRDYAVAATKVFPGLFGPGDVSVYVLKRGGKGAG